MLYTYANSLVKDIELTNDQRDAVIAEYPYLIPMSRTSSLTDDDWRATLRLDLRNMVKNVKAMLKRHFPGIKFSVQQSQHGIIIKYKVSRAVKETDLEKKVTDLLSVFRPECVQMYMYHYYIHTPFTMLFGCAHIWIYEYTEDHS